MPLVSLSTTAVSMSGLGKARAFCLTGSAGVKVQIEACATLGAASGSVIKDDAGSPIVLSTGSRVVINDPSTYLLYRIIGSSGTVSACWVDGEDVARGAQGEAAGVRWDKAADDGAASTATAKHFIYRAPSAKTITAVRFIPDGAVTAHDTNYATVSLTVEDGAGANVGTAASQTTKITGGSGNWVAGVPVAITLGAHVTMTAGQVLTVAIAKAASGVVVKSGTLQVDLA